MATESKGSDNITTEEIRNYAKSNDFKVVDRIDEHNKSLIETTTRTAGGIAIAPFSACATLYLGGIAAIFSVFNTLATEFSLKEYGKDRAYANSALEGARDLFLGWTKEIGGKSFPGIFYAPTVAAKGIFWAAAKPEGKGLSLLVESPSPFPMPQHAQQLEHRLNHNFLG